MQGHTSCTALLQRSWGARMARHWWEGSQREWWWARTDPGQLQLLTVPCCMSDIPPFHPPCSPALAFLLFISTRLTVPVCQSTIAPSERTGMGQGGTLPQRGVRGCLQTWGHFPTLTEEGSPVPGATAAASSPRARLWAGTPVRKGCPLLQYTPRALTCRSCPQSDRKADCAASTGRDCWTPVQGPSDDCQPFTHASSLCSPLPRAQAESNRGNVYGDASLRRQFTSSLTVSLQRSFFFNWSPN